jgi:hypothetical protein
VSSRFPRPASTRDQTSKRSYMPFKRHGWKILSLLILIVSLPFLNGLLVIYRAESIALDRPYCIQVVADNKNDYDNYREAKSFYDVSPFVMFTMAQPTSGSDDMAFSHHGILVLTNPVGFMNWSYRSESFRSDVLNRGVAGENYRPKISCAPEKHFGVKLLRP